jgi:hypothetical protein
MGGDADTYLVDTSAGEVTVHYGWESWVTVEMRASPAQRAVVGSRGALERLLVAAGVPQTEARSLAPRLWKGRPKDAHRAGVSDPWMDPWKHRPTLTLVMFLLGLAVVVVAHVVFHVDWVGW